MPPQFMMSLRAGSLVERLHSVDATFACTSDSTGCPIDASMSVPIALAVDSLAFPSSVAAILASARVPRHSTLGLSPWACVISSRASTPPSATTTTENSYASVRLARAPVKPASSIASSECSCEARIRTATPPVAATSRRASLCTKSLRSAPATVPGAWRKSGALSLHPPELRHRRQTGWRARPGTTHTSPRGHLQPRSASPRH